MTQALIDGREDRRGPGMDEWTPAAEQKTTSSAGDGETKHGRREAGRKRTDKSAHR